MPHRLEFAYKALYQFG